MPLVDKRPNVLSLMPTELANLTLTFQLDEKNYLLIGNLNQYSVHPYSTHNRQFQISLGLKCCNHCELGWKYEEGYKFQCHCPNAFEIKRHILLHTVTDIEWQTIMDMADLYNIQVYVASQCAFKDVKPYSLGVEVYIPNTQSVMQYEETTFSIPGVQVLIRKPIICNLVNKFVSMWTRRMFSIRVYVYNDQSFEATDLQLKYALSLVFGAKYKEAEQIHAAVARIAKDLEKNARVNDHFYRNAIKSLNNMNSISRLDLIHALVLNCFMLSEKIMVGSQAWIDANTDSLFDRFVSTIISAPAFVGNKPIPKQAENSNVQMIKCPLYEDDNSNFIEIGPSINGYDCIVPPAHSVENVLNTIQTRQNAEALPVLEFTRQIRDDMTLFLDEFEKHCQIKPFTFEEVLSNYHGPKLKVYEKALKRIKTENLLECPDAINTVRKSFIKQERLFKVKPGEETVAAFRLIQGVDPVATLTLLPYIMPLSEKMAQLGFTDSLLNKFTYVSGLDANGVGDIIHQAIEACVGDYWAYTADNTLFDACQREWTHNLELDILKRTCEQKDIMFEAAYHVMSKQADTIGFVHDWKTESQVRYHTDYTRKSGDANTSQGNSAINIAATFSVLRKLKLYQTLERSCILGDDNLSIFAGAIPRYPGLSEKESIVQLEKDLTLAYAHLGIKVKIQINKHIAQAEFCSMILAPITIKGIPSLTLVAKLGKYMNKYNKVKASSVKTIGIKRYVFDNLYATQNSLQFYPGLISFNKALNKYPGHKPGMCEYDFNMKLKTPDMIHKPDLDLWDQFLQIRYGLALSQIYTEEDLLCAKPVYIEWFDCVACVDLQ